MRHYFLDFVALFPIILAFLITHLLSLPLSNMVGLVGMEWGYGSERLSAAAAAVLGSAVAPLELESQLYRLLGSKSGRFVE